MNILRIILLLTSLFIVTGSSHSERIAFLTDIHVTPGNKNDSALKCAVSEINQSDINAIILGGDLTNEGSDEQIINVYQILDKLKAPLFSIPGNHENNWSQSATKTFNKVFGKDRFKFKSGNILFVGLNCGPYMKMGDGHIKQEDLHWLEKTLSKELNSGDKVISINHYPIRENDIDNYVEYASILSKYPVICHLNGHYHKWISYDIFGIPAFMLRSLDSSKNNFGYSIIDISSDSIKIFDKQLNHDPIQRFSVANKANTNANTIEIITNKPVDSGTIYGFSFQKLWTDSASVFCRLAIDDKSIYFGTSDGKIKSINKKSGTKNWEIPTPDKASLFSRPIKISKTNLAVPYCNGLIIVSSKTGKHISHYITNNEPYVADGIVDSKDYFQGGYKKFESRNLSSGKIKWKYDNLSNYCQAAPAVSKDAVVFGAWDTYLRALDRKTGKEIWKWSNGKTANMYSPGNVIPVISNNKVIIVAPDRYMTAIDLQKGKTIWRDNSHRYRESLGVSRNKDCVYAKTMDGELIAVSAIDSSFKELWKVDLGLGYDHAPCIVIEEQGVIYCGSRNGYVIAIDANTKNILWKKRFGTSEINGFEIDIKTKDIYFSLIEGTIWKIQNNQ